MNSWGAQRRPFVFLLDFNGKKMRLCDMQESKLKGLIWRSPQMANFSPKAPPRDFSWHIEPPTYAQYLQAFQLAHSRILKGDSYLLNLTMPTKLHTNLSLEEIANRCMSPYLVYLKEQFVCFSPEIFVRINRHGRISSYPMKGTIDAAIPNAEELLKSNRKEMAEHHTIVDLIRNDLSQVSSQVKVARFAYLEEIKSKHRRLLQMSSEIEGQLGESWHGRLGDIFACLLPAGSITGAPKPKTTEIIRAAENYERGWYTGVFGLYDGQQVDSCVLIRFIEQTADGLLYKSGGGITHLSEPQEEYHELINKVYVPFD